MRRRHDRHNRYQHLFARLLPRRLRGSERVGHGQPKLGGLHGDVYSDRVGDAARPGEGLGNPGRRHVRLDILDGFLAVVWEKDEAVARPDDVWEWWKTFIERPRPVAAATLLESISAWIFSKTLNLTRQALFLRGKASIRNMDRPFTSCTSNFNVVLHAL